MVATAARSLATCMPASPAAAKDANPLTEIYRGTGMARRSKGRPTSEYVQLKKPTIRKKAPKPSYEIVIDLGAKLGLCRRCTCPVHEADITDGYAEKCDNGEFECLQASFEDSCREYASNHPEDVAAHATLPWQQQSEDADAAAAGDETAAAEADEVAPEAEAPAEDGA